ncbi:DUF349 domain-containing protein [Tenacibaculum maritimum]|uniref:DUF349 domain-containing protein n=1 Tax=Tenacibaculum maritimum TaxID=107401 RepID=UPI001E309E8A|nr:DUF349 domain-containing protein [Tenacibaculum maritimum]MCD9562985.1 DUF349 domain-containing protein [Tenacibaculum maritimum]MCD9565326.1 DUF349 domain-containing protein [Tenacibaculum maritimum]MCD9578877.1 DUF349 domain-containing protein [Tenacibaculum maritimum]MCD9597748.1 DUF349 domain-containing protein [Tenacibaculum maritimum]MCD9613282.1 DUF349 domain-containing protein [Tenacibaculum maritimum]
MLENSENSMKESVNELTGTSEIVNETTKAVEAIEEQVAEEAEKADEKHAIPMNDYASMNLEKLTEELEKLLKNHPIQQLKVNVDAIKNEFNSKFGALLAEKKEAFLEAGGNSIDFYFSSPIKTAYNKLLGEYKAKKDAYYGALEKQLKDNLEKRNQVIEDLKELIASANANTMYNDFKELEKKWKTIGAVPRTKYNDTWKIYHHHVERFYDFLHLNKDFRELDFKHNLEEKLKLIDRAEGLNIKEDINEAFKELQELHRLWKEEIGPVSKEHREDIWERFSAATKKIHDKRHEHFRLMKSKHQEIIDKKLAIVEEIRNYDTSDNKTHSDWQKSIVIIEALRKKYFDAGKLPYAKSEAVWQKFKEATKKFNHAKNIFYKEEKGVQNDNLNKKMALVELAESLKDSEDWEEATNTMKKIQADWKKIGHVPRKFSDDVWKRFKGACNYYFDRLHDRKNELNKEQQLVVDTKKEFLEKLEAEKEASLDAIKEAITNWRNLGSLPRNARHIEGKFNKQIDMMLEGLNLDKEEIAMLKFKNVVESYLAQEDYKKLDAEQFFVRKKIDETIREMQQLENNLSFISNAKADNPLVMNVRSEINKFKEELDVWKLKLKYLKKLDY